MEEDSQYPWEIEDNTSTGKHTVIEKQNGIFKCKHCGKTATAPEKLRKTSCETDYS